MEVLDEESAPRQTGVSGDEDSVVPATFGGAHAVEELLRLLVDGAVEEGLAIAADTFEFDEAGELGVLDLEADDPHAEGELELLVFWVDAVPLADPNVGRGWSSMTLSTLARQRSKTAWIASSVGFAGW